MAQPIYSTSVRIDSFKGLNQAGTGANMDMQFAAEMENVNVHNGEFAPMREGLRLAQELEKPIGTLAYMSRRYTENPGTLLVAISDGNVFTKELDGNDEWVQRYSGLTEDDCDWTTYETSLAPNYSAAQTYHAGERVVYKRPTETRTWTELSGITLYCSSYSYAQSGEFISARWFVWSPEKRNGAYVNPIPIYSSDCAYAQYDFVAVPSNDSYMIYMAQRDIAAGTPWAAGDWMYKRTVSAFSEQATYSNGSVVYFDYWETKTETTEYDALQYRCLTDIDTPEAWNPAHWELYESDAPTDVLLFTNAQDGMYCLYGDTLAVRPVPVTPDPENNPEENIKFGVIARYNERIWGCGIEGDPDKLMYSAPYNAFDWSANFDIPEDGAGDVLQPTWDGDSFISLRQFGSDLMAIKRNSIWRIYGTHPGEFAMVQQYGGGTIEENTVAVQDQYMYMLGEHGLMRYDGVGAYALLQDAVQRLMTDKVNHDALNMARGAMRNGIYCLALPVNGSEYCNAVLEYSPQERTFSLRTDISVDSFLQIGARLFYTSATEPGRVFEMQDLIGSPLPCTWISGYQDLGLKNSIKSAFTLYMMVESEVPVELRVGIRTEKKLKQKIIYTKPGKMTRMHLNNQGREFRLEIQSYSAVPFTIAGGIKIDLELDPD